MATLQDHTIVMHPGPMIRGMEITADVADSDRSVIVEQVTNGVAVRMAVLYLLLGGSEPAIDHQRRGRAPRDQLPDQEGADPRRRADRPVARRRRHRGIGDRPGRRRRPRSRRSTRPAWSRCRGWSTCTPTCASRAARTPRPSRPAPGPPRWAASPRCTRWPTPIRSPTPPASSSRSGASVARPATATCSRSARSRSDWAASSSPSSARWPTPPPGSGSSPTTASASSDPVLMRRALEYVKAFDGVIAQHAQEPRLTEDAQMNEGELSRSARPARLARGRRGGDHRPRLPARRARRLPAARLPRLDRGLGGDRPLGQGAAAKDGGWDVTAEVCPHHLLLTDELAATYDPIYKVNPPLRTAADVEAVRAGLADGTIDIVATDHAPHPHEDKDCEWQAAAFGMLGLETALSIVQQTMVDTGLIDWAGVAERMSYAPARIGRLDRPRSTRSPRASPPTSCSTTPPRPGWSTPARWPRSRATPRTPAWSCPAGWWRRSSAARPTVLDGKLA